MGSDPEVQIVSDNGIKNQFARGTFYRERVQSSKLVKATSLSAFTGVIVALIFSGSPDPSQEAESSLLFTGDMMSQPAMDLPSHETAQAEAKKQVAAEAAKGGKRPLRTQEKFLGPQLVTRPKGIQIPPGTMAQAVLMTGGSNGLVKAQLKESVIVNGETVIGEGSVLVGQGSSTEDRLLIRFAKAVLRDSSVEAIQAQAADFNDKIVGLTGSKVGHYAAKLAAAIGLNFVTGMSEGLQETEVQNGVAYKKPTVKNALYNGTAMAASQQTQELLSSAKNRAPAIEVPAGTLIYIIFDSTDP